MSLFNSSHFPRPYALLTGLVFLVYITTGVAFSRSPFRVSFDNDEVGKFPSAWKAKSDEGRSIYAVKAEDGRKFVHADAKDAASQIGYEQKWQLKDFPVLQWQWRADTFPTGSNERVKNGYDSVLAVYVAFGRSPLVKGIKYVWSDVLPKGDKFTSLTSGRIKVVVLESGRALKGTWVTERRDVLADYRELFGPADATPVARGIAVLTDSDDTHSRSVGDYGPFDTFPAGAGKGGR
jgi:hypothetical protein